MRQIWNSCAIMALAGATLSGVVLAQNPATTATSDPISKEVQGSYARVKANIQKSADKVPAEDYSYKPTPDIRTFARVLNHVTEAQSRVCGAINGTKPADPPAETADKATIVAALNASFAECDKAYSGLTDANMTEMFQLQFGSGPAVKRSRIGLLWGNSSHDTEQYATLALYMRLKGLTPPSSEK